MIYQGTSFTYTVGILPNLLEIEMIPIVFVLYGVIQCIGSIVWGKVYDRFGGKVHLFSILAFTSIGYTIVPLSIEIVSKKQPIVVRLINS